MRIVHICRNLGTGGIEAVVCSLSNEMVKKHDVTVCTIVKPSPEDKFYKELLPTVHRETIGRVGKGKPLYEMVKIAKFIKEGHYDIVHIHGFFYYFALSVLLFHRKIVFCYTVHSDAFYENNPWDKRILRFKRFCFRKRWINPISISPAVQISFSKLYQCHSHMIFDGVTCPTPSRGKTIIDDYRFNNKTKVFIHAARICPEKNQLLLCRVFDRLIKEGEDVVLLIAGPIHHRDIYDNFRRYFSNRISYIGDRPDIPTLLCSADGMCLTSSYEGLSMILLESISAGCIPICTAVGGVVNVIEDGVEGFLAHEITEESFYQAVKRCVNLSEEERLVMKNNCLKRAELFTASRSANEYLDFYRSLLGR